MAAHSAFVVLLIILVLGGAFVEATGRPFDSLTKSSSLNDHAEAIDDESLVAFPTMEDADEDLLAIPTTEDVDEETATIPMVEDVTVDEDLATTLASEDEDLVSIPALEDTDGERVAIPEFLRNYISSLDPERIRQYEAALESNVAFDGDGIAKDEVGEMFESLGDEGQSVTFDEKDIRKGQEIVFPEQLKGSPYPSSLFLPHALATKVPFSSKKIFELIDKLHISHKSKLATIMSHTLTSCELTKEKYSKETTLIKEKEKKKKKKKGSKDVVKEKKIVKEIEFSDEFKGEFGKVFEEKEVNVKKGKSIGDIEIKEKEVKKKETSKWKIEEEVEKKEKKKKLEKKKEIKEIEKKEAKWKKDEKVKGKHHAEEDDKFKKFLKKEVEKKEHNERKKKLVKEKEIKEKGYKETKEKEKKFKESKEKEFDLFELEGKKERLSKENEMKKKLFDKEKKHREEEKYKVKEFKGKEVEKKGLEGKKDTKGKEFKVEKPKDKEFEVKEYKLKKEKVYKDKDVVIEKKELSKTTLKCVISLEDMTNFVKKKLPTAKYIKALETTSFTKHGDHKRTHWKVYGVKKHEKAVVCKKEIFPFAVFKCKIVDKDKGLRIYYLKLEGKDGVHRMEVVACKDEKKSLKSEFSKATTKLVLCRWITKSLIWVPNI